MKIISGPSRHHYLARVGIFLIITALIIGFPGSYSVDGDNSQPSENLEIYTWYDLDDIRYNLSGYHILMNDLNSTTEGYMELASPTANEGKGWEPIGYETLVGGGCSSGWWKEYYLSGTFDGQGHEICDLFINRPDENKVSLFYATLDSGLIINLGVTNVAVTGAGTVGGLVGWNEGTVDNSYSSGNVTGESTVGGLAGHNHDGTVFNSYSSGNVNGSSRVGGLVGSMYYGSVNGSHSMCSVIGVDDVGGLLGYINYDSTVSNSYATGNVTGYSDVGGLVGLNSDTYGESKSIVRGSYSTGNVNGNQHVGGLLGHNYYGTVSNSYATGNVTGYSDVGGLVGLNGFGSYQASGTGIVRDSYSTGNVNGNQDVGGLVGKKALISTVSNSFWDTETSGQATSDGGTGKNTTEMQNINTFSGVGWNIIAVLNTTMRDPLYIWNIVNNVTYPFLSWQSQLFI
jgi:hypothetical protein